MNVTLVSHICGLVDFWICHSRDKDSFHSSSLGTRDCPSQSVRLISRITEAEAKYVGEDLEKHIVSFFDHRFLFLFIRLLSVGCSVSSRHRCGGRSLFPMLLSVPIKVSPPRRATAAEARDGHRVGRVHVRSRRGSSHVLAQRRGHRRGFRRISCTYVATEAWAGY